MRKVTFVLALGAVCASILSGCKSKSKYKTPTNPYDKVSVALNGVEKSFANYKVDERDNASSKKSRTGKRVAQSDSSGALTEIAKLYQSYDSLGDKVDELDYSKPPMVQIRCIKRFFETIGQGYSFGAKFSDSVSGVVYFDPSTGDKKSEDATYKYDYNFTASLSLNINDSDLITGDIAFKIDLHQGNDITLQTNWYTTFTLDYEMAVESPTYTLSIFTENLETDLTYLDYGNTYEYDYVDMKAGRVNEWRKFCYEVNKRMVKDENHATFADYVAEPDFKSQIGSSKWYKNADLRKITHPNTARTNGFIAALFDKFGLNSTDINSAAFTSKGSIANTTIRKVYNEFSTILGQDAVYSVITGNEGHKQQKVKSSMKVMNDEFKEVSDIVSLSTDTTFRELFNGNEGNYSIWYFDENGEALEQIEDLSTIKMYFTVKSVAIPFGNAYLDTKISDIYTSLTPREYDALLTYDGLEFIDELHGINTKGMSIQIVGELKEQINLFFRGIFPYEINDLGFPSYDGENCLYDYKDDISTLVDISNTNQNELTAFENTLENSLNWVKEVDGTSANFRKFDVSTQTMFDMEIISDKISVGNIRIIYNKIVWPRAKMKEASNGIFDFNFPTTAEGYFEIDDKKDLIITLKNFSETEEQTFVNSLLALGDRANIRDNENLIYILKGDQIYKFSLTLPQNEEDDIILNCTSKESAIYPKCELEIVEKDGALFKTIQIDTELTGYFLTDEFDEGVYKIKLINPNLDEDIYLPINGVAQDSENVSYNEDTFELTVEHKINLDLRMALDNLTQVELVEITD